MSSPARVDPSPASSLKKRAFDALERRFALERAELVQEEQRKRRKESFNKQEDCVEAKIDENILATTSLSTPRSHLPQSKKGNLEFSGTSSQRQTSSKTGKDFHPAYSDLLEGINDKLLNSSSNLSQLVIFSNNLKTSPTSIGSCTSLTDLQAYDNEIEEIPESLCNLHGLVFLRLHNNMLQKLPQNLLKDLKSLIGISTHCNQISVEQFQQMAGFEEFEDRRRRNFNKQIDSNVLMNSKGLTGAFDS